MATEPIEPQPQAEPSLELSVDELMRRVRPLPPHAEMVIDNLTEDEGLAFWEAVNS